MFEHRSTCMLFGVAAGIILGAIVSLASLSAFEAYRAGKKTDPPVWPADRIVCTLSHRDGKTTWFFLHNTLRQDFSLTDDRQFMLFARTQQGLIAVDNDRVPLPIFLPGFATVGVAVPGDHDGYVLYDLSRGLKIDLDGQK